MEPFVSSCPGVEWPAVAARHSATLLSLVFQLGTTERLAPQELVSAQLAQLHHVLDHAYRTVPFYRRRFDELGLDRGALATREGWRAVQLLTRRDVQLAGSELHSTEVPSAHGGVHRNVTSGSTNQPVLTLGTDVTELFWRALTLRDHFWHGRDFRQSLAAIRYSQDDRAGPPDGMTADNWGAATAGTIATGPAHMLNIRSTIDEQAEWLRRVDPGYLLSYPSVLFALAEVFALRGWRLSNLRQLRTFGEILEPQCRETLNRVFGVPVVDMYSSQEVGYIALECPQGGGYHVQAENLLVEVIDDSGQPCGPGEIGRVVVTTLHNFAMPLVRYDIGDYAEVGGSCECGRGLPVLRRILGRQRNLLQMPDGRRVWPVFNAGERPDLLPAFYQFQVVQRSRQHLEVHVVRHAPLTDEEARFVVRYMQQSLGYPFEISIRMCDTIQRSPSGKFEDFVSLVES